MDPFYFGEKGKSLLGFYHPASGKIGKENAVVICNPIGHEFIKSYSALRLLANRLAQTGSHVLRFDYYATGDSYGTSQDGSIHQWVSDIKQACHELEDVSGCNRLTIVGMRFGALLALRASTDLPVTWLIMLHPVLDGNAYLDKLGEMQSSMLIDEKRFHFNENSPTITENEFLGHPFKEELTNDIRGLSIDNISAYSLGRIDIFPAGHVSANDVILSKQNRNQSFKNHEVVEEIDWNDIDAIEDKIIINKTISAIVDLVN